MLRRMNEGNANPEPQEANLKPKGIFKDIARYAGKSLFVAQQPYSALYVASLAARVTKALEIL
jgi:hypothetical protein